MLVSALSILLWCRRVSQPHPMIQLGQRRRHQTESFTINGVAQKLSACALDKFRVICGNVFNDERNEERAEERSEHNNSARRRRSAKNMTLKRKLSSVVCGVRSMRAQITRESKASEWELHTVVHISEFVRVVTHCERRSYSYVHSTLRSPRSAALLVPSCFSFDLPTFLIVDKCRHGH